MMLHKFPHPHFITGDFHPQKVFLQDDEYGRALDCLVKGCSDVLVSDLNREKIFLGKRIHEPQPNWWFVGGRMRPGESPEASAARVIQRELGIQLTDLSRLRPVTHVSMAWARRVQPPAEHGTCDISCILTIAITEEEAGRIRLTPDEYCDGKWVDPRSVVEDDSYHPALRHAVRGLLASWEWDKLIQQIQTGASNDVIGAECRRILAATLAK